MARTETLRTYVYWKNSKWSVPKHCELTTAGKFPNGPYRNIANLRLLENSKLSVPKHCELMSIGKFQMVRSETLRTYDFWKISKWSVPKHCELTTSGKFPNESVPKHCELTTSGKFPNSPYRNIAMLQNRIPRNTEKSFVGLRMRT
jgi:hypothetical protein